MQAVDGTLNLDYLTKIRQHLHKHPELSGQEKETATYISQLLSEDFGADQVIQGLGNHGVAAIYHGKYPNGPTILFRCELDALPIMEESSLRYKSKMPGIAHSCGHDGHMAILLGLAQWLQYNQLNWGRIVLLFQPAEETGAGAMQVLKDPKFAAISPDVVYALHNLPGYKKGEIIVKEGPFTLAVNSIILKLKGKTSHAGEPHMGINPAVAIAEIIQFTQALNQPDRRQDDFCIFTPIHAFFGEKAYGVSAGHGELHYTLRTLAEEEIRKRTNVLLARTHQITETKGLELEVLYTDRFFGNTNAEEAVWRIRQSASTLQLPVYELDAPLAFGEDFGAFTQKYPGAMFGIGAGRNTPALHNANYDFPDDILLIAIKMLVSLATSYMGNDTLT